MKTLVLLRHGKSDWSSQGTADHDRPINERGRLAATQMARWMADEGLVPDRMLVSSALRTQQTADRLAEVWGNIERREMEALYLAEPGVILNAIRAEGAGDTLLVVAHNPGIAMAAMMLTDDPCPIEMPTCAAAVLRFAVAHWTDVSFGGGKLLHHVKPKSLA